MFAALVVPISSAQNPIPRPVALAQKPPANLGTDGLLDPESDLAEVPLVALVGCSAHDATVKKFLARFEVKEKPKFASAIVTPLQKDFQLDPAKCADANYRVDVEAKLLVTATREAPGLRAFPVQTSVVVEEYYQQGGMAALPPAFAVSNLTVGYLPLVTVEPGAYFQKTSPGSTVRFPVGLTNLGNALTIVKFSIIPLGKNRLANVTAPAALELESRAQTLDAEHQKSVEVVATAPSQGLYTNSIYSFQLETNAESTDPRGVAHDQTMVTLSIQVQGTGGSSPAPSVLLGLLAAIAVAVLRKRRSAP